MPKKWNPKKKEAMKWLFLVNEKKQKKVWCQQVATLCNFYRQGWQNDQN